MRKAWLLVGAIAIWWWMRGGDAPPAPHRVQAAALPGGFAMLVDGEVVVLDTQAKVTQRARLQHSGEVRFVGMRKGPGIGWKDGRYLKLARITKDGTLAEPSVWGKEVVALCDNAATNDYRFGVAWLESNDTIWFVHGPTKSNLLPSDIKPSWCGIASAEDNIALLFRDGQRTYLNLCTPKGCSSLILKLQIDPKETLLGYGCVRDACLFATRDKHGTTKLYRVDERGRMVTKPLEGATRDTVVAVVGAGRNAFAISYMAKDGRATIQRITKDLGFAQVWHFTDTDRAPSLAWNAGKLLVAEQSGKAYVLDLPRQ
jgi:hypothetical protein